ncbi:hypothetical protein [Streptacidiphilus monticola]|jgi:hypothetical protein|uniref:Glycosyltransferase n=1 Tax=Streptacidiphilus monticola TaxID=2161674 RepID=A0ABW1G8D2_9ACTN
MASHSSVERSSDAAADTAVLITARDDAARIALTVLRARELPGVVEVVVADLGSSDSTARVAADSGALVLRAPAGGWRQAEGLRRAATAASGHPLLLVLRAGLQEAATRAGALLEPLRAGETDAAFGRSDAGPRTLCWDFAVTAEAFRTALPLAEGAGLPSGMIIDLRRNGFRTTELVLDLPAAPKLRWRQRREVARALRGRRTAAEAPAAGRH